MSWYDAFSYVYDVTEPFYRKQRAQVAAAIRPDAAGRVVDLACGTGQNFACLLERIGPSGELVGIDASPGMLKGARRRIERYGWSNVKLLEADARALDPGKLGCQPDCVVCTLGLSAIPDWETVFGSMFELLRPGGQFVILDVYAERRVPQTWWVELIARADLSRRVWEPLERSSKDFAIQFLPGSPHLHGGRVFLASGSKSAPAVW